jgi:Tfp pilus assembly major pilin PilA
LLVLLSLNHAETSQTGQHAPSGNLAKAQFAAGLAEISPGKTLMEISLNEDKDITNNATGLGLIGLQGGTRSCTITAIGFAATGNASINCVIKGTAAVQGKTISLRRAGAAANAGRGLQPRPKRFACVAIPEPR